MEVVIIYNMNITIKPFLYQLSNKGYMAWEYNPFHNFRITDTKTVTQINSEESSSRSWEYCRLRYSFIEF